ncbi:immunoglobulin lambda-1 light chain-like [Siniperca chuatsi]|uniref:immunoglobulin lambda-1 light chain-like n=1 Tax=Siniperca chuatsi TaxID=119488 RepID=UPI001CE226A8|nr:immunoglobulin lambda-1 light chain-like [Siniperca chuatsi]
MLSLPAAALCCLCSALVAMAAELIQDDLTLTRRVGEAVAISCGGSDQCSTNYVYWYQKKDREAFTRILRITRSDGQVYSGYNHPQINDFSAVNKQNGCELKIQKANVYHSASYYCSCWKRVTHRYYYYIFGSGTKLYVTDEQMVKPVVSVYPAASRAHLEGKSSLLCLASAMFPPLVQFSWKRQKENGPLEDLPSAEGEQLEFRELGCTAAIRVIDRDALNTYKYRCYVQHEGGTVEAQTEQGVSAPTSPPTSLQTSLPTSPSTSPPPSTPPSIPTSPPPAASVQYQCRVKLLCLLYTVLIVKSLVYCCGLSLLMILRNKGPSTNCTQAD